MPDHRECRFVRFRSARLGWSGRVALRECFDGPGQRVNTVAGGVYLRGCGKGANGGEQRFILNRVRRLVVVDDCPLTPCWLNAACFRVLVSLGLFLTVLFTREPSQFRWSVEPYADGDR